MAITITPENRGKSITLQTGQSYRFILVEKKIIRARLVGFLFDTAKSFILPGAMSSLKDLVKLYKKYEGMKVVVTGHTDSVGSSASNLDLGQDRAEAVSDFLKDNVDGWLRYYDSTVPKSKRWGPCEDGHMLRTLGYANNPKGFQNSQGLAVDGIVGPNTRRALVTQYMAADGTTLPSGTEMTSYACGEFSPRFATADGIAEQQNRRVELFFFRGEIDPVPEGPRASESSDIYSQWLAKLNETMDLDSEKAKVPVKIQLFDDYRHPITDCPYSLDVDGEIFSGEAENGVVEIEVDSSPHTCNVQWGYDDKNQFLYQSHLYLNYNEVDNEDEQIKRRLANLGYKVDMDQVLSDQAGVIRQFQFETQSRFSLEVTGELNQDTKAALLDVHDTSNPVPLEYPSDSDHDHDNDHHHKEDLEEEALEEEGPEIKGE